MAIQEDSREILNRIAERLFNANDSQRIQNTLRTENPATLQASVCGNGRKS